MKMYQLLN